AFSQRVKAKATSSDPTKLAREPSQVFFGLKCGASGFLPAARPTKYATVSPTHVITSANSSSFGPCSPKPCRRTAYVNGNATNRNPLELMPAAGKASTRGRLVQSVSTATPITKPKNASGTPSNPAANRPNSRCNVNPPAS